MHPAVEQIRQYLQLIALQFVQHPEQAELRVAESPQGDAVRFRLILEKTDVARIIGRNGMTASAIRSLAKAAGENTASRSLCICFPMKRRLNSRKRTPAPIIPHPAPGPEG